MSFWNMTARARGWFTKALVGAAGVSVITLLGWFVTSHLNLVTENKEQSVIILNHEETINAQWGIISRMQESNNILATQTGIITTIQRDIIIPTLRQKTDNNIFYEKPPTEENVELKIIPELKYPPLIPKEDIDPEDFSREQTEINKRANH